MREMSTVGSHSSLVSVIHYEHGPFCAHFSTESELFGFWIPLIPSLSSHINHFPRVSRGHGNQHANVYNILYDRGTTTLMMLVFATYI